MASAISEIDQLLRSLAADKAKEVSPSPLPPPPPLPASQSTSQHKVAVVPQVQTPPGLRTPPVTAVAPQQPSSVLFRGTLPAGMTKSSVIRSKSGSPSSRKLLAGAKPRQSFAPACPESIQDAGLHESDLNDLILKFLLNRGIETGFKISLQIGLKFPIIESLLRQLKLDRLLQYKNSIAGGDYLYELTDLGRDRARALAEACTYYGTAPVPLDQYIASVKAQTIDGRKPTLLDISNAFSDLNVNDRLLSNIGQAIHSGRGMFLYGAAGNGKTSMAERITKSFGDCIWIPRSITAGGEIIRMFDPNKHKVIPVGEEERERVDGRWLLIERPTIVAGGELRMDNLEITYIRKTGIGEAPLQMKANCGTLLIDDFGRQRMSTDELLNRWIVPLEQRHDFLHLESGRSIQVPFDQLIIFSSNLEPRDLVDDAFLRRIPYKIEVKDPTEAEFRTLFLSVTEKMCFEMDPNVLDYVVETHYMRAQRPFRFCHPRDLLRQVENRCTLHQLPRVVTKDAIDQAVENYFSIM